MNYMHYSLILIVGCLLLTSGDSDFESEHMNKIKDTFKNITKLNIQENIHVSKWMDECENKLGLEEWTKIKVIPSEIYPCMRRYLKLKVVQEEIDDSVSRGDLDLVFKKYCGRKERILNCLYKRLERIKSCLDDVQIENLNITQNAIDAGVDFICSESGDKIALFMAEKGKECITEKEDAIKNCLNKYFPGVSQFMNNLKFIPFDYLFISENTCRNFTAARQCIVDVTSSCEDPTPSNILDSLMTQALKVTPCAETSSSIYIFHIFINQILHPYLLTVLVGILTATHIIL